MSRPYGSIHQSATKATRDGWRYRNFSLHGLLPYNIFTGIRLPLVTVCPLFLLLVLCCCTARRSSGPALHTSAVGREYALVQSAAIRSL